jgi:hypothetical protein
VRASITSFLIAFCVLNEVSERGVTASNAKFRKEAEEISKNVLEGSICAVECWDEMESEHNFFLCEVCKHPDGTVMKEAPSQARTKKHTDNGPLSQPIRMHDPLFAAKLFTADTTNDTAGGLAYIKGDKTVLINGRGFRYRLKTGEFKPSQAAPAPARQSLRQRERAKPAVDSPVIYRLQPAALEAVHGMLYAQGRC